jgi:L-ascorbate metabolism protein UlaG (beta-lactamase superfamily)
VIPRALSGAAITALLARARSAAGRHAAEHACMRELDAGTLGLGLPPGLALTWLGTAGFALAYQGHTLLIDPYVSRAGLLDVARGRPLQRDLQRIARHVPRADAVLVGHTHFDHALDVPAIARLHGCKAYGSRSLVRLMQLSGAGEHAVQVEPLARVAIGPFEVTFVPSLHAKLALGLAVPNDGEITCEHLDAMGAADYRCGDVFGIHVRVAGITFYHQGSANLVEEHIPFRGVDYLLLGIAGRRFTRDYVARSVRALAPHVIVPTHHDDFFRPLGTEMGFSFNVRFDRFVEEAAAVSRSLPLRTLQPLATLLG